MSYKSLFIELSNEKGESPSAACRSVGINPATFTCWTHESVPREATRVRIAAHFGISLEEFDRRAKGIPANAQQLIRIGRLPIYGNVSAGLGELADNTVVGYEYADEQFLNGEYYYLHVRGDSMSPKIEDGDLVLVHKQSSVDSGDIAVVTIDDEDGVVKKVEYDINHIHLISFNPYYPVRDFENEDVLRIRVMGRVVRSIRKY